LASSSETSAARLLLTLAVVCAAAPEAGARVLVTQDKALTEAFPAASVTRKDAFLTDVQAKRVEELSGSEPSSRVVAYYVAIKDGKPVGTAYFDTHLVRTLPETVMIVVDPEGKVAKVEVLSFEEPPEYLPKPKWFEQFKSKKLDRDLAPGRGIPVVTGATLTSRAVAAAVRRALALHAVLAAGAP
jgi:Na+-translocating ferredoxin:NAD+ oxidoreductase RnfG subunit